METSSKCVETWRTVEFWSEQISGGVPPHPTPWVSDGPHFAGSQGHAPASRWMLLPRQAVNSYTFPAEGDPCRPSGLQLSQDPPYPHRGTQFQMPFPI